VIVALGCAPGLGFVHTGHIRSLVYDSADLYKTAISIPIAFDIAARNIADIGAETRRAVRDHMKDGALLETCVRDIKKLLAEPQADITEYGPAAFEDPDIVMLWDNNGRSVPGGVAYGDDDK
jgi:CRISPR-associated protein Cas1